MLSPSPPRQPRATAGGNPAGLKEAAATKSDGVTRRLQSELMGLTMSKDAKTSGVSAFPDGENLFHWRGNLKGVDGTPYEGLTFKLDITFPPQYPFEAPSIVFLTPMFHPNVDAGSGGICLDILKDKWSASLSISAVLQSLRSLLGDPNNQSPLNVKAASLWMEGAFEEYRAEVLRLHASGGAGAAGSAAGAR